MTGDHCYVHNYLLILKVHDECGYWGGGDKIILYINYVHNNKSQFKQFDLSHSPYNELLHSLDSRRAWWEGEEEEG